MIFSFNRAPQSTHSTEAVRNREKVMRILYSSRSYMLLHDFYTILLHAKPKHKHSHAHEPIAYQLHNHIKAKNSVVERFCVGSSTSER